MDKNKQFLAYILKNHPDLPVTSLMKLSYLIDLVQIKKTDKQISNYKYARYKYGPFDDIIYSDLKNLINNNIIQDNVNLTTYGEYITYCFNEENDEIIFDKLKKNEKETIEEVVESVNGFGAKALVELAYRTKPMKKIGATIGGVEGLNNILDLKAS